MRERSVLFDGFEGRHRLPVRGDDVLSRLFEVADHGLSFILRVIESNLGNVFDGGFGQSRFEPLQGFSGNLPGDHSLSAHGLV